MVTGSTCTSQWHVSLSQLLVNRDMLVVSHLHSWMGFSNAWKIPDNWWELCSFLSVPVFVSSFIMWNCKMSVSGAEGKQLRLVTSYVSCVTPPCFWCSLDDCWPMQKSLKYQVRWAFSQILYLHFSLVIPVFGGMSLILYWFKKSGMGRVWNEGNSLYRMYNFYKGFYNW